MDPVDPRVEATTAVHERVFTSLVRAVKVLGAVAALSVPVAAAFYFQGAFSEEVAVAIGVMWFIVFAGAFLTSEFERLHRCRGALERVLMSSSLAEDLLRDAREQRDKAVTAYETLAARLAIRAEVFTQMRLLGLATPRPAPRRRGSCGRRRPSSGATTPTSAACPCLPCG